MDLWISQWISGFHSRFLDFIVDFWISQWISGFQFGFLPTVYEISFVSDPSGSMPCQVSKSQQSRTKYNSHSTQREGLNVGICRHQ